MKRIQIYKNALVYTSLFLAIILFIMVSLLLPLNSDIGWLYHATQQWLEGKTLYLNIYEINPPMIFFIMSPAVLFESVFNLNSILTIKLYFSAIILVPFLLFLKEIKPIIPLWLYNNAVITSSFIIIFITPYYDFSQRDHLSITFLLPYVIARYKEVTTKESNLNVTAGIFAGLSICIKPYFIPLILLIEAWATLKTRTLKISLTFVSSLLTATAFFFIIIILFPHYIDNIVPLAIQTYWAYGNPLSSFPIASYLAFNLLIYAAIFHLKNKKTKEFTLYLNLIASISLLSFIFQSHYNYQLVPFKIMTLLSATIVIPSYFQANEKLSWINKAFFIAILGLLSTAVINNYINNKQHPLRIKVTTSQENIALTKIKKLTDAKSYIDNRFHNQNIYVLSSNVWPSSFITHYTAANWISGFPTLWPLPALFTIELDPKSSRKQKIEAQQIKSKILSIIVSEINLNMPKAILVESSKSLSYYPAGFTYHSMIDNTPDLKAIFEHYTKQKNTININLNNNKQYDVYIRNDTAKNKFILKD